MLLLEGDCRVRLAELPDCSVDSVVCDPPYELGFMGKGWDSSGVAYDVTVWAECLRVLKPGGHLLAFGGSRTYHRLACAVEDAGFEIRDQIMWIYGSGFPKSLDVSKAIDKQAGAERQVVGPTVRGAQQQSTGRYGAWGDGITPTAPSTPEAVRWSGWGTALKPAHEPVVVARKPLAGTVAQNVLGWGVGGLNIDGCRVPGELEGDPNRFAKTDGGSFNSFTEPPVVRAAGRWPANVIHDGSDEVLTLFPDTVSRSGGKSGTNANPMSWTEDNRERERGGLDDRGSAARFFYCAKAGKKERNAGLKLCGCDKLSEISETEGTWDNEDQQAAHRADTELFPIRDTDASGTPNSSDSAWSTSSSGNSTTGRSQTDTKSTTSTTTNLTTDPKISYSSTARTTRESTPAANFATTDGGSRAVSATNSNGSAQTIGTSAVKDGPSTGGADPATSGSLSNASGSAGNLFCLKCDGVRGGHPTVKPIQLMRYLCRLVTPPAGTVLDPFLGSGTTGIAATLEGFNFIGIEQDAEYLAIAQARIKHHTPEG